MIPWMTTRARSGGKITAAQPLEAEVWYVVLFSEVAVPPSVRSIGLVGLADSGMVLGRQWASISISAMMAVFVCVC